MDKKIFLSFYLSSCCYSIHSITLGYKKQQLVVAASPCPKKMYLTVGSLSQYLDFVMIAQKILVYLFSLVNITSHGSCLIMLACNGERGQKAKS